MKQLRLSLGILVVALAVWSVAAPSVRAQALGTIAGTVTGPGGPVVGVTVNIVNNAGVVVGTAVTSQTGAYSVGNLPVGTYTIQVVSPTRKVLVTSTGTVTTAAPTAAVTVNLTLTASQLEAAALAAGGGGMGTTTKVVLAVAAAAGAGVFIVKATKDDTSPTR